MKGGVSHVLHNQSSCTAPHANSDLGVQSRCSEVQSIANDGYVRNTLFKSKCSAMLTASLCEPHISTLNPCRYLALLKTQALRIRGPARPLPQEEGVRARPPASQHEARCEAHPLRAHAWWEHQVPCAPSRLG